MKRAGITQITAKNRGHGAVFGNPLILGESHDSAGKKIGIPTIQPGYGGVVLVIDLCVIVADRLFTKALKAWKTAVFAVNSVTLLYPRGVVRAANCDVGQPIAP